MDAPKDFGEKAREIELADSIKRRRINKIFLVTVPLIIIAILFFVLQTDIANSLKPTARKSKPMESNINNSSLPLASNSITILQHWNLPNILKEISGLSWLDKNRFACVQDEIGKVFIYNSATGTIEKEIQFAGPGDYEGLALVHESIWVIRSDGTLFEINSLNAEKPVVTEYDTPLSATQNAEGLCFHPKSNSLLVALKEDGLTGSDQKGVYNFDLSVKVMPEQPLFKINLKDNAFTQTNSTGKKDKKSKVMMPSGIAIHPTTGEIYITDGRNPKLLVTDISGNIKTLYVLNKNEFSQPEGITFSPSGELYISNEGVKAAGNILKLEIPAN